MQQAQAEAQAQRWPKATALLTKAVAQLPQAAHPRELLMRSLAKQGRYAEAAQEGQAALALSSDLALVLYVTRLHMLLGDWGQAKALFALAVHRDPLAPILPMRQAEVALATGDRAAARRYYAQALPLMEDDSALDEAPEAERAWLRQAYTAGRAHRAAWRAWLAALKQPSPARWQQALAQVRVAFGPQHLMVAQVLYDQARTARTPAEHQEALRLLNQSLALSEQALGANHPLVLACREQMAFVLNMLGRHAEALSHAAAAVVGYDRVLRPGDLKVLGPLGTLATAAHFLGHAVLAGAAWQRRDALAHAQRGPFSALALGTRIDLAQHHANLGDLARADRLVREVEARLPEAAQDADLAPALRSLAALLGGWGEAQKAAALLGQASRLQPNPALAGFATEQLQVQRAQEQLASGNHDAALAALRALQQQAEREHGAQSREALRAEGRVLDALTQAERNDEALALARLRLPRLQRLAPEAWPLRWSNALYIALHSPDPGERRDTLRWMQAVALAAPIAATSRRELHWHLARMLPDHQAPATGLLHGRVAVALTDTTRADLAAAGAGAGRAFAVSSHEKYRDLVVALLRQGRHAEAEAVLQRMRSDGLAELAGSDASPSALSCVQDECRWLAQLTDMGRQLLALERAEPHVRLAQTPALSAEWERLTREFETSQREAAQRAGLTSTELTAGLPPGAVLLRVLVDWGVVWLWGHAPGARDAADRHFVISVPLPKQPLDELLQDLRSKLGDAKSDLPALRQQLQGLHGLLIAPLQPWLDRVTAGVPVPLLLVAPDQALAQLSFAALFDGRRYLVERYAVGYFNDGARAHMAAAPTLRRQAAFGLTEGLRGYRPLLHTQAEVVTLAQRVPGLPPRLDGAFTRPAFEAVLQANRQGGPERTPIVHVASHFEFGPAEDPDKGLLLGDGSLWPLSELRRVDFTGTELLTLSACQTAESRGLLRRRWLEVDGFAQLALKNGAHAVMATLWPAYDWAAAPLMGRFYAQWGRPAESDALLSKPHALRQAQLDLMKGQADGQPLRSARGRLLQARHPAEWAPFVVLGNWR
ncbi:CHAT domain-containing protein [Rubrivivax rivuli]|uniref:CHAT domain-containing protein n=1 Tax=Rubrivivax rivuli TaxID=1862385 RepID=UPI0013E3C916|nr:CHAT domain-containing tetratricopeptide repeat protein [Rubrivivax rivuli]